MGNHVQTTEDKRKVLKRFLCGACALALAAVAAGCGDNSETTNAGNVNSNAAVASNVSVTNTSGSTVTRTAPDGSVITTETANGVTTETRTFGDPKGRVERVVVTTRDGRKTARVYYRDKSVRELPDNEVERALTATGDAIVSAGGKVVEVSKDAGAAVADKVEDVPSEADDAARATAKGAKKVGTEAADKAEDVGGATVNGAKKAGKATAKGAKKVGGALKDAVTP
jgi:ABC-type Fe3+-hydroxamate transport system substrate-binding protein